VELTTIAPQILPSPWLGKGLGGMYWIDAMAMLHADVGTIDYHYMHNLYLVVGFRMGLVGLFLFGSILYSYFRQAFRAYQGMPRGVARALTAGMIAGVAGQVVLSMSSPTILTHPTCGLTACAMAVTFRLQDFSLGSAIAKT
jgi:O-antigen ligase